MKLTPCVLKLVNWTLKIFCYPQYDCMEDEREDIVNNSKFIKLDKKLKELETEGRYSSNELPALSFERAKAFYRTAQVDDREYNTEKIKQAFSNRYSSTQFDSELFRTAIRF